jgi:hypothetical protein
MFRGKTAVRVEMAEVDAEKENLASFLQKSFKLDSSITRDGLDVNGENVSAHALARIVNKFVYHKNLNSTYWVVADNNVVKIKRFKHDKKEKKNKHSVTASTIRHGW